MKEIQQFTETNSVSIASLIVKDFLELEESDAEVSKSALVEEGTDTRSKSPDAIEVMDLTEDIDESPEVRQDSETRAKMDFQLMRPVEGSTYTIMALNLKPTSSTNLEEDPAGSSFKCHKCDFSTERKAHMKRHILERHTVERPYKCIKCIYRSERKSNVFLHYLAKHTVERPFKCAHCHFSAVRKSSLERHILSIHLKERPHRCFHCGRHYTHLKKHILRMHLVRPYKCPQCGLCFALIYDLKRHTERHTLSQQCSQCSYRCATKRSLMKHFRIEHPTKVRYIYDCTYCDYSSGSISRLTNHMWTHHL